jgi:hypothetical protein
MDVVYLVKNNPKNNSEELRYSLRSLANIPHGTVYIVGEKPDWVTNVTYLPVEQNLTKPENVRANMRAAAECDTLSDDFILMNDDFFFMKPITSLPQYNFGPMQKVIESFDNRYPEGSEYIATMKNLYEVLKKKGIANPLSYELHIPMVLSKLRILNLYDVVEGPTYQFRTYYGNYYKLMGTTVDDVKLFLNSEHNDAAYVEDYKKFVERQTFLSVTGGAFQRGLPGEYIRSVFSQPSMYEK